MKLYREWDDTKDYGEGRGRRMVAVEAVATPIPWCKTHDKQMLMNHCHDGWFAIRNGMKGEVPSCRLEDQAVYRIQLSNIDSEVSHD